MPRILSRTLEVPSDAIDENGHVNNQAYLRWMQDLAVAHSAAVGWPLERYLETGATWVVRSHYIEYIRPAFEGDVLGAHTWVDSFHGRQSLRRFLFTRGRDGEVVVRAETKWVFVDLETGRPKPIPDRLREDFPIVPDAAAVATALGLGSGE